MRFRHANPADHSLLSEKITLPGGDSIPSISLAYVTDNEEGQRYWVVVAPYTFGQFRIQAWCERSRGEPFPAIFHEL